MPGMGTQGGYYEDETQAMQQRMQGMAPQQGLQLPPGQMPGPNSQQKAFAMMTEQQQEHYKLMRIRSSDLTKQQEVRGKEWERGLR